MAFGLSLRTYRCPHCKEMINTSMVNCRYCSTAIQQTMAEAAADRMEQINKACNEVNYLKAIIAGVSLLYVIDAFLRLGDEGGSWLVFPWIGAGVVLIRWWVKYRNVINDSEKELRQAKRTMMIATGVWIVMPIAWLALGVLRDQASR